VRTIDKMDGARTQADDQIMPVGQRSCSCAKLAWILTVSWAELKCRMSCNDLHGEGVAAPSSECTCVGVCAFLR